MQCQNLTSPVKLVNHDAVYCINKTGVTKNTIFKVGFGVKIGNQDNATKCFIKCLGEKLGWIGSNGEIMEEPFFSYVKKFVLNIKMVDFQVIIIKLYYIYMNSYILGNIDLKSMYGC